MRIIHFISSPCAGGAETYVRDLSIEMQKQGHSVHILFLQSASESQRDARFESDYLQCLLENKISFSFVGKKARLKPWIGLLKLRREVRDFDANLVHCHLYYALFFSFFIFGVPIVYTHHSFKLGLPKIFYRVFDLKVSSYVAICSACHNLLSGNHRQIIQINNAVSIGRITPKLNKEGKEQDCVTFVFVGSLRAPKNLELLLKSFAAVQGPKFRLLIVGEGDERERLEQLAHSVGIEKYVSFLGNRSNVDEIISASDCFVMSSAWEGLPIALIEATLAGLPVVVTNVGGCAEIVHRCANGFVVDDLNVEAYSVALGKMLRDEGLRASFSKNAFEFSAEYEINVSVAKHLRLYESLNRGRRPPGPPWAAR